MKILRCICIALLLSNLNVFTQTWEEVNTPNFGPIYHTVFNQKGALLALAKHHGVYLNPGTGKTWEIIGSDFSAGTSAGTAKRAFLAPNADLFLYDQGIYRSSDDGKSWEYFKNGLSSGTPRGMASLSSGEVFSIKTDSSIPSEFFLGHLFLPIELGKCHFIKKDGSIEINSNQQQRSVYEKVICFSDAFFGGRRFRAAGYAVLR